MNKDGERVLGTRLDRAALCLALFVLTRAKGVLPAGVAGLAYLCCERRVPWRPVWFHVGIAAPWLLFSTLYVGWPAPERLAATMERAADPCPIAPTGVSNSFLFDSRLWVAGRSHQLPP